MNRANAALLYVIGLAMAIFHLYAGYFGQPEAQVFRTTHVAFALALTFLMFPASGRLRARHPNASGALDFAMLVLVALLHSYILYDPQGLMLRTGDLSPMDLVVATAYLFVLLEATRRAVGMAMLLVALFFMLNAVVGDWFPGIFYGPPHAWRVLADVLYLGDAGIFGIPVAACASYITLFIIFGQLLQKSRALDFFMDLALVLTGRQIGGPAKAAVVASAFEGTYSGSAVANVVGSGSFTIPLMKRLGYPAHFAAGVEAVASSGGQIMPPVMGVTAFVMAEIIGVPYWQVAMAALIPAILYFVSVYFMVHFEACKLGLKPIPKEERPRIGKVMRQGGHLLLPIVFVFYLLSQGYSVSFAASYGIIAIFGMSFLSHRTRMAPRDLVDALEESARAVTPIAIACAAAGVIIGAIMLSDVGNRFSELVLSAAHGQLWLALFLTMVASFILGMGLTTTADYIVLATFVLPALVKMGADTLGAHMFAFYFSSISGITPPVALASFAAAAIARAGIWETSFIAIRIGIAGFIIPYLFIYNPELLLNGTPWSIALATGRALAAVVCLAAAFEGWLLVRATLAERLALFGASVLFVWPEPLANTVALLTLAAVTVLQMRRGDSVEQTAKTKVGGRLAALAEKWALSRRLARLAEAEVAQEAASHARRVEHPGERAWGWPLLAAVAAAFVWASLKHIHILNFNVFLGVTLVLSCVTVLCFTRRAPARHS